VAAAEKLWQLRCSLAGAQWLWLKCLVEAIQCLVLGSV